nr:immunoglobulin heavy chain junction region [Mus musculus]
CARGYGSSYGGYFDVW